LNLFNGNTNKKTTMNRNTAGAIFTSFA